MFRIMNVNAQHIVRFLFAKGIVSISVSPWFFDAFQFNSHTLFTAYYTAYYMIKEICIYVPNTKIKLLSSLMIQELVQILSLHSCKEMFSDCDICE